MVTVARLCPHRANQSTHRTLQPGWSDPPLGKKSACPIFHCTTLFRKKINRNSIFRYRFTKSQECCSMNNVYKFSGLFSYSEILELLAIPEASASWVQTCLFFVGLRLNNAWASGTVLRPFLQPESPLSSRSLVSGFKCKLRDLNSRPPILEAARSNHKAIHHPQKSRPVILGNISNWDTRSPKFPATCAPRLQPIG